MSFVRRLAIALIIGIAVSIGVAWLSAAFIDVGNVRSTYFASDLPPMAGDAMVGIDPAVPIISTGEAIGAFSAACTGFPIKVNPRSINSSTLVAFDDDAPPTAIHVSIEARGWPFLCLWCAEQAPPPRLADPPVFGGVAIGRRNVIAPSGIGSGRILLPYRQLGVGLALNTLIFAAAILGVTHLRKWIRRTQRGVESCDRCGYSLAGLPTRGPCPECGGLTPAAGARSPA